MAMRAMLRERVALAFDKQRKALGPLGIAAASFTVYLVYRLLARYRLGADVTDEALLASITHRFALGDAPLHDEINLRQGFALVVLPFYWLKLRLQGSTDGIVLFLRHLYLAMACGTALAVHRYARDRIGHWPAVVVALAAVVFVPFNLPTCTHETLGSTLFTAGIFLSLWRLSSPAPRWSAVLAGFTHALAIIAFAPLALAALVVFVAAPFYDDATMRERLRNAALHLGGALLGAMFLIRALPLWRPGYVQGMLLERAMSGARNMERLRAVADELWTFAPAQPRLIVATLLFVVAARSFGLVRLVALPAVVPGIAWWMTAPPIANNLHTASLYFNVYAGLAGLVFLVIRGIDRSALRLFFCGFLPSAVAALTFAWASDQGSVSAGFGAFPASILAVILATEIASNQGRRTRGLWWATAAAASIAYYHVDLSYTYVYRDLAPELLTAEVKTGPYRGLRTNEKNAVMLTEMTRVLRQYEDRTARIISYYDFPACFLMTQMKPGFPSVQIDARLAPTPYMLAYYKKHLTGRGLAMHWPWVANKAGRTDLDKMIEDPARVLFTGANGWVLYREPAPP